MKMIFNFLKEVGLIYNLGVGKATVGKKLRILKYFIRRYLFQEEIPVTVIMGLTYRCQCDCAHCSVDNYRYNSSAAELQTEEIKSCIDEISLLGSVKLNFFGGEPLLRDDIVELVSYASKKDLFVYLDTNGFLLSREMAKKLKKAGLACVIVSLDSFNKAQHDGMRKLQGLYDRAVDGLICCGQENIPCVISTIATHDSVNSGDLASLIQFAKQLGVAGVRILLPMLSGKWVCKPEYLLSEEELNMVWEHLDPGFVYLESGFSYSKGKIRKRICQAAKKGLIYISPYGDVQMCYTVPYSYGNIKENSLREIIGVMWRDELFRAAPRTECIMNEANYRTRFANRSHPV